MAKLERWGGNSYRYITRSSNKITLTIEEWQDLLEALNMVFKNPVKKDIKRVEPVKPIENEEQDTVSEGFEAEAPKKAGRPKKS